MAGTLVRIHSLPLSSRCSDAVAALAGLRQPLALATVSAARHRYEQADAIHPSSFPAQTSVVPIESVPTGSRVGAINPQSWDYDDTFPEPDPYSWSRIDLVVSKDDGTIVDVELLRPDQWILDHDLFVGAELPIEVTFCTIEHRLRGPKLDFVRSPARNFSNAKFTRDPYENAVAIAKVITVAIWKRGQCDLSGRRVRDG